MSHKHRFIYVRILGAADAAVLRHLQTHACTGLGAGPARCGREELALLQNEAYAVGQEETDRWWREYFVFSFVRNPWARLSDTYKAFTQGGRMRRCGAQCRGLVSQQVLRAARVRERWPTPRARCPFRWAIDALRACHVAWHWHVVPLLTLRAARRAPCRRLPDGAAGAECGAELAFVDVAKRAGAIGSLCTSAQCCARSDAGSWKPSAPLLHVHDQSHCLFDAYGRCAVSPVASAVWAHGWCRTQALFRGCAAFRPLRTSTRERAQDAGGLHWDRRDV